MKKVLYLATLLAFAGNDMAQAQAISKIPTIRHNPLAEGILRQQHERTHPRAKGTALKERLIAACTYHQNIKSDYYYLLVQYLRIRFLA